VIESKKSNNSNDSEDININRNSDRFIILEVVDENDHKLEARSKQI